MPKTQDERSRRGAPRRAGPGGRRRSIVGESPATAAIVDAKRDRILAVAERLFFEHGYAHTTMEQIVRALGVTKPYVYYYFHNKLEIYETLCWRPTVACFTALDFPPGDARPARDKLAAGLRRLVHETVLNHPAAFFAYREPQVLRPEYQAAQLKLAHHFYDKLVALLERARAEGSADFDDAKVTALAACSIPGFLFTWYRPDGRLPPEAMVDKLGALVLRVIGLRLPPSRSRASSPALTLETTETP